MKHSEKTTCFAYKDKGCAVLTEMICKQRMCPFFKTEEQFRKEQNKKL